MSNYAIRLIEDLWNNYDTDVHPNGFELKHEYSDFFGSDGCTEYSAINSTYINTLVDTDVDSKNPKGDYNGKWKSFLNISNFYYGNCTGTYYFKIYAQDSNELLAETVELSGSQDTEGSNIIKGSTFTLECIGDHANGQQNLLLTNKGGFRVEAYLNKESDQTNKRHAIKITPNTTINMGFRFIPKNISTAPNAPTLSYSGNQPPNKEILIRHSFNSEILKVVPDYYLYRSEDNGVTQTLLGTYNVASIVEDGPATLNKTYQYATQLVPPKSSTGGNITTRLSPWSESITCYYQSPSTVQLSLKDFNSKTNISITKDNTVNLSWNKSSGQNITINSYLIYRSSEQGKLGNQINEIKVTDNNLESYTYSLKFNESDEGKTYYYSIQTKAKINNTNDYISSNSNPVSVYIVQLPEQLSINFQASPNITRKYIKCSWQNITINGATCSYDLNIIKNQSKINLDRDLVTTNFSIDVSQIDDLKPGDEFNIELVLKVKSIDGDSLEQNFILENYLFAPDFDIPDTFWKYCVVKEEDIPTNEDENYVFYPFGYDNVYLGWSMEDEKKYTYTFKYKAQNSSIWQTIEKQDQKNQQLSLSSFSGGENIYFAIEITDEYNYTQTVEYPYSFKKIPEPQISEINWNNLNQGSFLSNIKYQWKWWEENWGDLTEDLNSSVKIMIYDYNEEKYFKIITLDESLNSSETNKIKQYNIDYRLVYSNESEDNKFLENVVPLFFQKDENNNYIGNDYLEYTKTIISNEQICYPKGRIEITLSSSSFPNCKVTKIFDFTYDYRTSITTGRFIFSGGHENDDELYYYNPGDIIEINCTEPSFIDAAGNSTGANISYLIEYNNRSFIFNNEENRSCTDTAIFSLEDTQMNYKMTVYAIYQDGTKIEDSIEDTINIARWNSNDNIYLSNIILDEETNTIQGELNLFKTLCSSTLYDNLLKIEYSYIINNEEQTESSILTKEEINSLTLKDNYYIIPFDLSTTTIDNLSITTRVVFYNISYNEESPRQETIIIKQSPAYILSRQGATMALRKGRVGINAGDVSFSVSDERKDFNSSLYVNGNAYSEAPVMEINSANGIYLAKFTKAGTLAGSIEARQYGNDDIWGLTVKGLTQIVDEQIYFNSDNWNVDGDIYKIYNPYITSTTIQEILPNKTISLDGLKAFQKANFIGGEQEEGWCEIICFGTKPTIDIPITLIIRGG